MSGPRGVRSTRAYCVAGCGGSASRSSPRSEPSSSRRGCSCPMPTSGALGSNLPQRTSNWSILRRAPRGTISPVLTGRGARRRCWPRSSTPRGCSRPRGRRARSCPTRSRPGKTTRSRRPRTTAKASVLPQSRRRSPRAYHRLVRRAQSAASRGNLVRACILLQQARRRAPEKSVRRLRSDVRRHLAHLVGSLQAALRFSDAEVDSWQDALSALVARAAEGPWGPESRLLFDLQKIGVDRERHVYAIDVWGWARSRGKQPLTRPLPCLADVLVHRHLRSALRRMTAVSDGRFLSSSPARPPPSRRSAQRGEPAEPAAAR